jgi:anti-sigma B factor antagonist
MSRQLAETLVPNLQIHARSEGPFVVLDVAGELDLATQPDFERAVIDRLTTAPVVVDLSGLEFFAISSLSSLVVCHTAATSCGRELWFAAPSRQLVRLLHLSGLDDVLAVHRTVDEVVRRPLVTRQPAGASTPWSSTTRSESVR